MAIIRIEINVRYEQQETIIVNTALMDLFSITRQVDIFFGRKKTWYLTGYSRKEALTHIVFDEKGPTEKTVSYFEKSYKKDFPLLIEDMWDGEEDNLSSGISYSKQSIKRPNWVKLELNLKIDSSQFSISRLIELVEYLATSRDFPYIQVETNEYTLRNKQVFPDRLSVGWMLYQPRIIDKSYLPMAEDVLPVYQNNEQIGTLIITKKGIFDGRDQDDIDKSNDVEIQLVNLGLLPLITEV
ncbi:Imm52 family immunity protein [Photorhabdus luminescens]|uniref:Imm52 family immunity protein n=1 Tax=Photorhabdus luminescens TaxID=29488 RepID=UPI00224014F0|nr:Imm52 family immunity protein [Photorhabdus luminescens]MCW7762946.1 immunity 52 family protein [Photorhabdus luminescens subsp. venezuelensis]